MTTIRFINKTLFLIKMSETTAQNQEVPLFYSAMGHNVPQLRRPSMLEKMVVEKQNRNHLRSLTSARHEHE